MTRHEVEALGQIATMSDIDIDEARERFIAIVERKATASGASRAEVDAARDAARATVYPPRAA